jgi:hypothetical protein
MAELQRVKTDDMDELPSSSSDIRILRSVTSPGPTFMVTVAGPGFSTPDGPASEFVACATGSVAI